MFNRVKVQWSITVILTILRPLCRVKNDLECNTMEFFLNEAELSLNSANLTNH